jgi:hypothetical protein
MENPLMPPDVYISPNYPSAKLDAPRIDDLIDVYEDRIVHWVLVPAKTIAATENGAPAGLCLLLTYFEGAWSYKTHTSSNGRSKEFFVHGFVDVFTSPRSPPQVLAQLGALLYKDARCGFFHEGLFRDRIYVVTMNHDIVVTLPRTGGVLDLDGTIQSALIDVQRCIAGVEKHFATSIAALRDPANTVGREAFQAFFKTQCDWESDGPIVALD